MSATHLALLRGVNVGGKNRLPMKDLAAMFVDAGCENVRTFIQSGNVLFRPAPGLAAEIPDRVAAAIAGRFGYRITVVLRTAEELAAAVAANPFVSEGAAEGALFVLFLADLPEPGRVAGLDPDRSPPDTFVVRGREVFLHLPGGAARSKLTNAFFDARLGTTSTARNWRTVNTLLGMLRD